MAMIDWCAWGVSPRSATGSSRPENLMRALGLDQVEKFHHGRTPSTADSHRVDSPALAFRAVARVHGRGAVLSPVMVRRFGMDALWVDMYDDWSIAPDINFVHRVLAADGYRLLRESGSPGVLTVNSQYMAGKLAPANPVLLPNGVSQGLGSIEHGGDAKRRLILVGKFHPGRIDEKLFHSLLTAPMVEEVVVVGLRKGDYPSRLLRSILGARNAGPTVRTLPPTPVSEIGPFIGVRTIAAVPHQVRDYTLSQDIMKVYQFLALGLPVLTPRALWPPAVPLDFAYLVGRGAVLDRLVEAALDGPKPTFAWRQQFVSDHSWEKRASLLRALISHVA